MTKNISKNIMSTVFSLAIITIANTGYTAEQSSTNQISQKEYTFSKVIIQLSPKVLENLSKAKGFKKSQITKNVLRYLGREGLLDNKSRFRAKIVISSSKVKTGIKFTLSKKDEMTADFIIESNNGQTKEKFDISVIRRRGRIVSNSSKSRIKDMTNTMTAKAVKILTGV